MTKICRKCGKELPLNEFHKDSKSKDGYKNICRKCRSTKKIYNNHKQLDRNLNTAIYRAIKQNKPGRKWEKIVGYSLDELKKHLEKQFYYGMSWENYGKYWKIDRIIPLSYYSYNEIEFKKAWSLKNCRPILISEFHKKKKLLDKELIKKYNLYDIIPIGVLNDIF